MRVALCSVVLVALVATASANMFESMFGGGGQQRQRRGRGGKPKGNDMKVELQLDLTDVYTGTRRDAQLSGKHKICEACKGSGAKGGKTTKCPACKGQGQVNKPMRMGPMMVQMQQPCDQCRGKGVTFKQRCPDCGGGGIVEDNKALTCIVDAGMKDGDELKFDNEASVERPDVLPGDLIFVLRVDQKRSKFKRDEDDPNTLHLVEYISLKESLLGFGHTVKHLDNHQVITTYSGVTQPYQVRKVQGEGMPIRGQGRAGDLLVEHRVRFPNQVTPAQKEKLLKAFGGWPKPKEETTICAAPPCTINVAAA